LYEPSTSPSAQACLSVEDLHVEFGTPDGVIRAVNGVSFSVAPGETLGVVGESGSGKSVSALSVLGLVRSPGRITSGRIMFDGKDLRQVSERAMRRIRGRDIALVSQDPMTSFNPVMTIGDQLSEAIRLHDHDCSHRQARDRSVELLERVGVPNPARRFDEYPHQYSGGMRQRALIAMAMCNRPTVLIADEPTTALDVTIQAQVLDVLRAAQQENGSATILITHDLGVVAEMVDRVVVMYGGKVVEEGGVRTIFHRPRHPYTVGLMSSLPRLELGGQRLTPIKGNPPSMLDLPRGCSFQPRCPLGEGRERCRTEVPPLRPAGTGQMSACHFHDEVAALHQELVTARGPAGE
jgi:oligopeptide/dipeptide ABC transporter ATP-binding protein